MKLIKKALRATNTEGLTTDNNTPDFAIIARSSKAFFMRAEHRENAHG